LSFKFIQTTKIKYFK